MTQKSDKKKAQSPIKQILKDIIEKTLAYKNDKKKNPDKPERIS